MSSKTNSIDVFDPDTGVILYDVPVFKTAFDVPPSDAIVFPVPSDEDYSALQSFKDECDINVIVRQMDQSGYDRFRDRVAAGSYMDFSGLPDYQEAMNVVLDANAAFMDLPADLRKRFDNDPAAFLAYVDTATVEDLQSLGLIEPPRQAPPENPAPISESTPPKEV